MGAASSYEVYAADGVVSASEAEGHLLESAGATFYAEASAG